jgi:hypothetical protein
MPNDFFSTSTINHILKLCVHFRYGHWA